MIFGSPLIQKRSHLGGLVSDKSNDHAVEVEEEHDQVETQLEERFLSRVSSVSTRLEL